MNCFLRPAHGKRVISSFAGQVSSRTPSFRNFYASVFVIFMDSGCDLLDNSIASRFWDNTGMVEVMDAAGKTRIVKMSDQTIPILPESRQRGRRLFPTPATLTSGEITGAPAGKDARQTGANEIIITFPATLTEH